MPLENIESCLHCERSKRGCKCVQRNCKKHKEMPASNFKRIKRLVNRLNIVQILLVQGVDPGHIPQYACCAPDVGSFLLYISQANTPLPCARAFECPFAWKSKGCIQNVIIYEQSARLCWNLASEEGQLPHTLQVSKPPAGTCRSEKDSSNKRARHGSAFVCGWQNVFNEYLCYKPALKTIWFVAMILNKVSYVQVCLGRVQFSVCFVNYAS